MAIVSLRIAAPLALRGAFSLWVHPADIQPSQPAFALVNRVGASFALAARSEHSESSTDVDVVATADDGYVKIGTDALVNNDVISVGDVAGNDRYGFTRFLTSIPQGATCSDFTLSVYSAGAVTITAANTVRGLDEDSSAQVTGGLDLVGRSTTTATESYSFGAMTTNELFEIDVNDIVQEIVSRAGFSGVIQFRIDPDVDNGTLSLRSFDATGGDSAYIPNLSGTYDLSRPGFAMANRPGVSFVLIERAQD